MRRYYKKFNVPDMDRLGLQLQASKLSLAHANNTLIITVSVERLLKMTADAVILYIG